MTAVVARVTVKLPAGLEFFAHQQEAFEARRAGARWMILRWHRQSGKGRFALGMLATEAVERAGVYAWVSPTFRMSRETAWDARDPYGGSAYLDVFPPEIVLDKNENQQALTLATREAGKTSRIIFTSADDADRLRGLPLAGAVLDEFATMASAEPLHIVRAALAASNGWLLITSTPKGMNHFHEVWRNAENAGNWYLSVKTIDDTRRHDGTPIIPLEHVEQERREGQAPEWIDQEYFVRFTAALVGSYFGDVLSKAEAEGRITDLAHRPGWPVTTAWDLGISDLMVVISLQARRDPSERIHVLGAEAWEGQTVAEVFAAMQRHGYVFGEHLMPHDAQTRNVATRTTPEQVMRGLGQRVRVVPRADLLQGINAVRNLFPRLVFDRRRCATLLEMLGAYIKEWDAAGKLYKPTPRHNQASHYADALRCLAMGHREPREVDVSKLQKFAHSATAGYGERGARDIWGAR